MDAYPNLNTLYLSPRLQARLADAAGYPVTTIVAPTGYGKTTAAQYLQRRIAAEAPDARVFRQVLSGGRNSGPGSAARCTPRRSCRRSCLHSAIRTARTHGSSCWNWCRTHCQRKALSGSF